tara:strand:+ start:1949 stop:5584 length:3636 start_codon:yes stop_codon:yes gene_type:complete
MRKTSYKIFEIIAALFAIISILFVIFLWQLTSIVDRSGGVKGIIQSYISDTNPGLNITIEDVGVNFGGFKNPLIFSAENIKIEYFEDINFVKILKLGISVKGLYQKKIIPVFIDLEGINLNLVEASSKQIESKNQVRFRNWELSQLTSIFFGQMFNRSIDLDSHNESINFSVRNSNLVFFYNDGSQEKINHFNFKLDLNSGSNEQKINGFSETENLDQKINFEILKITNSYDLNINFEDYSIQTINRLVLENNAFNFSGKFTGEIKLNLNQDLNIISASTKAKFNNINFVDKNIFKEFIPQNTFNGFIDLNYSLKNEKITLNDFLLNNGQSELKSNAVIEKVFQETPKIRFKSRVSNYYLEKLPAKFETQFSHLKIKDTLFDELFFRGELILDRLNNSFTLNSLFLSGNIKNSKIESQLNLKNVFKTSVSGNFEAEIENDFQINKAKGSLNAFDFLYLNETITKPINLKKMNFNWGYDNNTFSIYDLKSSIKQNQVINGNINFSFNDFEEISQINLELNSPKISYNWIYNVWPENFGNKTKSWLSDNFSGDFAEKINLKMNIKKLASEFLISDFEIDWIDYNSKALFYKNLPEAYLSKSKLNLNEKRLLINFENLSIDQFDVSSGKLKIEPVFNPNAKATFELETIDFVKDLLILLDNPYLNLLERNKLGINSSGEISVKSKFDWLLKNKLSPNSLNWFISAKGENLDLYSLPYQSQMTEAKIELVSNNKTFNLKSIGKINNISSEFKFNWVKNNKSSINIKLNESSELTKEISGFSKIPIIGKTSGIIEIEDFDFNNFEANTILNFEDTKLTFPIIGFEKKKGNKGLLISKIEFKDGKIRKISEIQSEIGSFELAGEVTFNSSGIIEGLNFNHIVFPGNRLRKLTLKSVEDGKYLAEIFGERVDITKLKFNSFPDQFGIAPINFRSQSEIFLLPGRLSLNGSILGELTENNNLKAEVEGTIKIDNTITFDNSKLSLIFNNGDLNLFGTSSISGIPVKIKLQPINDKLKKIVITGSDAGKILNGLGITDLVYGGKLKILVNIINNNYKNYEALINISKFHVIDAPILAKLISTLSLTGILNLLEDEGIYFEESFAKINFNNGILNILKLEAVGEALAVSIEGWVDRKNDILQVHGTMAPATLLTKIFEQVPILSELIIGKDKAGVVLTEFKLDGSISKPLISFRPLSSAPGLLRDILNLFRSDGKELNLIN